MPFCCPFGFSMPLFGPFLGPRCPKNGSYGRGDAVFRALSRVAMPFMGIRRARSSRCEGAPISIGMDRLEAAYRRVAPLLEGQADSLDAVRVIEEHRQFWRPARPRVVLLAESHVYTSDEELASMAGSQEDGLPSTFARFVYCLGYGEPEYVGQPLPKHAGTPQFWKVFWACLHAVESNSDFAPVLKSKTPSFEKRIQTKRDLLVRLRDAGIWLVDASIVALYRPGRRKPRARQIREAIVASWDSYVADVVAEARSEHIVLIGKGVAGSIQTRLSNAQRGIMTVVPQPQARLSRAESLEVHRDYFRICGLPRAA